MNSSRSIFCEKRAIQKDLSTCLYNNQFLGLFNKLLKGKKESQKFFFTLIEKQQRLLFFLLSPFNEAFYFKTSSSIIKMANSKTFIEISLEINKFLGKKGEEGFKSDLRKRKKESITRERDNRFSRARPICPSLKT